MTNLKDLQIGQPVFLRADGNMVRRHGRNHFFESIITKIGRKYITIGNAKWDQLQFYQWDDGRWVQKTDYSPDWELYFSEQELLDTIESENLHSKIRTAFSGYGKPQQTVEQLRKIMKILEESKNGKND